MDHRPKKEIKAGVDKRREQKKIDGGRSKRVKEKLLLHYSTKDKEMKNNMRIDKKQWFENLATKAETEVSEGNVKAVSDITKNSSKVRQHKLNM